MTMNTFKDIIKSSFLEEFSSTVSALDAGFYLCMAAAFGFYIFLLYRVTTRNSFYNKSFNLSLWVLTVVIAAIIITISSNIVLSLGMVGALSIVRYRTAIKDPMDLVYLFWAIAEGIICGAGMGLLAAMLAVVVTVGLFVLDHMPAVKPMKILTISASDRACEDAVMAALAAHCRKFSVKSKVVSANGLNLVVEFASEEERACIDALVVIDSVFSVSSLTHDGEVTF